MILPFHQRLKRRDLDKSATSDDYSSDDNSDDNSDDSLTNATYTDVTTDGSNPSPLSSTDDKSSLIHTSQYHQNYRDPYFRCENVSIGKGGNSWPSRCDEEKGFDADVEDSDSTPEANLTHDTSVTSKTSETLTLESSEEHYLSTVWQEDNLRTPPKGVIRESPSIDYSPLSLSFDSISSSSISCSSLKFKSRHRLRKQFKVKAITHNLRPSEARVNYRSDRMSRFGYSEPRRDENVGKKASGSFWKNLLRKILKFCSWTTKGDTMFLLSLIIFLYSFLMVVLVEPLTLLGFDVESVKHAEFESFKTYGKSNRRRIYYDYEDLLKPHRNVIHDRNAKVMMKHTMGGLRLITKHRGAAEKQLQNMNMKRHVSGLRPQARNMYSQNISDVIPVVGVRRSRIFNFHPNEIPSYRHIVRELTIYPTVFSDITQLYSMLDSADPAISNMEPLVNNDSEECTYTQEWQSVHHPSCNIIHEIELGDSEDTTLIGKKGYWRNAWRVNFSFNLSSETAILKTPR